MKTNGKTIPACVLAVLLFPGSLCARGAGEERLTALTVYGLKGPSGVGMIRMFEEPPAARGFDIKVEALAQADLMAARFISGEARIGILPPNAAAKIAAAGKNIQIGAVTGNGMLSLLSSDPGLRTIEDLRGKTVEASGQGATPEYVFRRILVSRGINPDTDLALGFSLAYPEIAQSLIAGRISTALIPEPFATMARTGKPELRPVADVQDEWIKAGGAENYPMTVLVLDGAFAAGNPAAVQAVLESLKASIEWVTANPGEAGALVEKHDPGLSAKVIAEAIPRSNYVFIPAAGARPALEALFRAFLEFDPGSIGGRLPGDGFYYTSPAE